MLKKFFNIGREDFKQMLDAKSRVMARLIRYIYQDRLRLDHFKITSRHLAACLFHDLEIFLSNNLTAHTLRKCPRQCRSAQLLRFPTRL